MTFATQITRTPLPFDPDRGADALTQLPGLDPALAGVIRGTAGSSPYLAGLIRREADWLADALTQDPDAILPPILSALDDVSLAQLPSALRQAKRRVALYTALADLAGVWPLERVTGALTDLADRAIHVCFRALVAPDIASGKLPGQDAADAETAAGLVAIAMGKMGAHELNYSSDIDLICVFDESRYAPRDRMEVRARLIKHTRRMAQILSENTAEGYVFRTDLRLRPDASVTPVCISMDAAERYYEAQGRTWERAAHIKARPCAGDIAAGWAYLDRLRPFVYRKRLDFAAIQDAHDMRMKIRSHKGLHGDLQLDSHDMKLGWGGIREIEFFTQTRQLIAGGRDPDLRLRGTVEALAMLAQKDWIPGDVARQLTDDYRAHREVEHRVQMVNDAQTHKLPKDADGFRRLACLMGTDDVAALRADLTARLTRVADLTEDFFDPGDAAPMPDIPDEMAQIMDAWHRYPAMRSERAVEVFTRLKPELIARMNRAARPVEALIQFDGFLQRLPAGVQVFSLFDANPHLIDLIVDICATAPGLARYLGRHARVLEAVLDGRFFAPWPDVPTLTADLTRVLAREGDYEHRLDATRAWMQDWHFRIGVHHLRGLIDGMEAARHYAELAEAVLRALWPVVIDDLARRHGPPPGRGAMLLGMGSMGAQALTAGSDLDLIMIYDAEGASQSDGEKPLSVTAYYARLIKALITALRAPMPNGTLYEVDMRLRPSGKQGPVATSWPAFEKYQRTEAWTWEHLALTRARPVAGTDSLSDDVGAFRDTLIAAPRDRAGVLRDVSDMRARLADAHPRLARWEVKLGPGRMQDIELFAQAGALIAGLPDRATLDQIGCCVAAGLIGEDQAARLREAYRLVRGVQQAARLLTDRALDMDEIGEGGRAFLLREAGVDSIDALADRLDRACADAAAIIADVLPASHEE